MKLKDDKRCLIIKGKEGKDYQSRTGDYDFRACARARARGFRGSTFSVGRIRFAVCAERSRDKTCVF